MRSLRAVPVLALLVASLPFILCGDNWQRVVYATNWAQYRPSCKWRPSALPHTAATQALYAFAFINQTDYSVKLMEWNDDVLIGELQALKKENPDLKTLISIGGWTMNTPLSGYEFVFSTLVESPEYRAAFIKDAMQFLEKYGFDGIDLDWEYPADETRGGRPEDRANYPLLLKELREAMDAVGRPLLLTLAIGASWNGARGLDLPNMVPYVDGFNLMAYDLHGSWEAFTGFHSAWEDPSTGGIQGALTYYLGEGGIPPEKMILGLGFYGRSWTLASTDNTAPGAPAAPAPNSGGTKGQCTGQEGYLAWREIKEMLGQGAVESVDYAAKSAYLVLGDQWVSYDNVETLGLKIQAARDLGLGGIMVWAADLDDDEYMLLNAIQTF